jgi:starch-binding outer membrane protein, SusD/RagB family
MIKYNFKIIIVLSLLLSFWSCNDDEILVEVPKDFFAVDNAYSSPQSIVYAITGLHMSVRPGFMGDKPSQQMHIGTDMGSDKRYTGVFSNASDLNVNSKSDWWTGCYITISRANTILARIDDIEYTSEELKNAHKAEALFFRAFSYRTLANLYGGVPLELNEVTTPKRDYVRASREEVYLQCVEDLKFAVEHLPTINEIDAEGRIAKAAANHLLSEVYISLKEWDKAIVAASAVIENGNFGLMTQRFGRRSNVSDKGPYWDLFQRGNFDRKIGNTEAIWTMQYAYNIPGGSGPRYNENNMIWERTYGYLYWSWLKDPDGKPFYKFPTTQEGGRGGSNLYMSNHFKYGIWQNAGNDTRDDEHNIRRKTWRVENPDSKYFGKELWEFDISELKLYRDTNIVFQGKYMKLSTPGDHPADLIKNPETGELWSYSGGTYHGWYYMRLAETYLLRAEAYLGKGDNTNAANDINAVRARANASLVAAADVDIDYILDERLRELSFEELRRMTLSRLGMHFDRLEKFYPEFLGVRSRHWDLLPIPQSVIEVNVEAVLTQNPGYTN